MTRLALLLLVACNAAADPAPKPKPIVKQYPATGCAQSNDVRSTQLVVDAYRKTTAAYDAVLAKRGIQKIDLPFHVSVPPPGAKVAPGPTVVTTVDGVRGTYVVGPTMYGDVLPAGRAEFGSVGGKIVQLVGVPTVTTTTKIMACGCVMVGCSTEGMPRIEDRTMKQALYGPLASGVTYAGEQRIEYAAISTPIEHVEGLCQCPAIP